VKKQNKIKEYATIVHLYYVEGTLTKEEVYNWMSEFELDVVKLLKNRIEFTYLDFNQITKMTVWKSGKVEVQTTIE
tara:strand:- start:224 stop:451 length:228 start_codon:yes stop_codon:yes gene_type:complete